MSHARQRTVPWILWPVMALWRLLTTILTLTGRLVGVILGLAIVVLGFALSVTVIGAILGVPLIILGLLLMVRSIF
ncbi:MAG: hypothetical protein KF832_10110 [Caldilineaceae bacterium]|nr:hypothetical protein [Caldilineaceae bacterium]